MRWNNGDTGDIGNTGDTGDTGLGVMARHTMYIALFTYGIFQPMGTGVAGLARC